MDLRGKRVVVIGATGGIGRAFSYALALEGADLVLVGRRQVILTALQKEIEKLGVKVWTFRADVTQEKEVVSLVKSVDQVFKSVDVLVNAAGIGIYKPLEELDFEEWRLSLAANLDAVFLAIKFFLPLLKKSKAAYVIGLGSGMGKVAVSGRSAYCASKFGLRGLMLSLAKEYQNTNIHFCLLTLGSVLTAFGPLTLEEKMAKQKKGKAYLDPVKVAKTVTAKLKNGTLASETTIYPSDYFGEVKQGRT